MKRRQMILAAIVVAIAWLLLRQIDKWQTDCRAKGYERWDAESGRCATTKYEPVAPTGAPTP